MQEQVEAMRDSLEETRNIVGQNERMVKAAEESAQIAREAFYVGEAPYFGITEVAFHWIVRDAYVDSMEGARPEVVITFLNGGRTPAWHFSAIPHMILGDSPDEGKGIALNVVHDHECPDAENTFYPSGNQKCVKYRGRDEFSATEIEEINAQTRHLFLVVDIGYTDTRSERLTRRFLRRYNPISRRFGDATVGKMA